jgi:hypothetical protein
MSSVALQYVQLITLTTEYYLTPIFILGIFGNLANMIVFSQDVLRINGCSWYFIGVSFVNLVVLISGCLSRLIIIFDQIDLTVKSAIFCKIRTYLIFNSYVLSRHFLCVISIDRWMITSSNVYFRHRSNPRIARQVIIISAIFWHLINLFILIGFQPEISGCVPISNTFYLLMYTIINLFATLIPFIILILFSILTIRNIFKSRIRNITMVHPETNVRNNSLTVVSNARVSQNRNKDRQLIRLSLIQVITFIFLNICNAGYTLYQFITKTNGQSIDQQLIDLFIQSIGDDLVYTQSAVCFILIIDK